jgi:hypothetical protein
VDSEEMRANKRKKKREKILVPKAIQKKIEPKISLSAAVDPKFHQRPTNTKNEDYFVSEKNNLLLKEIKKFATMEEMQRTLVDRLNLDFGSDSIGLKANANKYVNLDCKYMKCPFAHWYNYKQEGSRIVNIEWFRGINQNHSVAAHEQGILKQAQYF